MNQDIPMNPTIGYFITMNPGYAGSAELPENLKVLFRPCAMCVPDLRLICEIMLVSEAFMEAKSMTELEQVLRFAIFEFTSSSTLCVATSSNASYKVKNCNSSNFV